MTVFATDFSEYTAGVAPPDWTDFWGSGGASYLINDDGDGISSQYLNVDILSGSIRRAYTWDDVGSVADVDIYSRLIAPYASLTAGNYVRVYARLSGSAGTENGYLVSIGNNAILLSKYVDGVAVNIVSESCQFNWASSKIWCRFQVVGTTLKVKVWDGFSVEPLDWLITGTDSDLSSGAVGVGTYPVDDFTVDYFSVNTTPPAIDDFPPTNYVPSRFGGFEACTQASTVGTGVVIRFMGGFFDDLDAVVKGVSTVVGGIHSSQMRMAVYSGGSLTTGPEGATLLADYGLTSGVDTNKLISVFGSEVAIPKNQPLWVAFKLGPSFSFKYSNEKANAGNFQHATGRFDVTEGIEADVDVAFPSTLSGISGSFSASWYALWAEIAPSAEVSVSSPVMSPPSGPVPSGSQVTITCTTEGATIYYTTDGSTPTTASAVYSEPIEIIADTTIKAFAVKAGLDDSAVASGSYIIAAANRAKLFVIT